MSADRETQMTDYFIEKLSTAIGDDRIIPIGVAQFAYIDTEACDVFLVTVQAASFVPAVSASAPGEDAT